MEKVRMGMALAALWLVPLAGGAQVPAADSPSTVNAVWVEKELEFTYMGFTSYYSCDGLRDKIRWVLKEIGARPGFKVLVTGCMDKGPDLIPHARIKAALPVSATPELLAQLSKDAAKRELLAKSSGSSAELTEATAQFPARPRRVEFKEDPMSRIEPGDCELVEQLRDHVFVPLGARVVEDHMRCVPHQRVLFGVDLTIEVLEPLPKQ